MSTYLTLVNNVLDRLNEVNLDASNFASARGIHAAAKLGVKNAILRINTQKWEWSFNYATTTKTLSVGEELYSFTPSDHKVADWDSFVILKQTVGSDEIDTTRLQPIQRQEWFKDYRKRDVDSESTGLRIPRRVFWYGSGGFGVTPSPDKAYVLTYNYWKNTTELSAATDSTTIPSNFDWVIEQGALESMYMFLDNDQRAQVALGSFKDDIQKMADILIPQQSGEMRGNMVNLGGGASYTGFGRSSDPILF